MFLAKIAMDIIAKKTKGNCAYLTTEEFKEKLWDYKPLSKFWQIGKGIEKRLNKMGLYTLKDVANCPEDKLYKEFGVNAYFLINHANGLDPTTIKEIKEYMPKQKSVSNGQVLERDYDYEECKLIIKEMVDTLVLEIVQMNLVTNVVSLTVGYSNELELPFVGGSKKLSVVTASYKIILDEILKIYEEKINKQYPIRRVNISFGNLQDESKEYYDLLTYNKTQFASLNAEDEETIIKKSGSTNHKEVKLRIEYAIKEGKLTDTQEEYLGKVLKLYDNGSVLAETSKKIKDEISKTLDSQDVYNSVKANIPETYLTNAQEKRKKDDEISEIILSEMLIK